MEVDALLCDAATVREGLLHVLGGGITRIHRPIYPAPLGLTLAMQLILHPTETREQHRLRILIQDTDGASIAELDGEFGLSAGQDSQPGEMVSSAMVLNLTAVAVPTPGAYSVDVLIDGQHVRSIGFLARDEPIAPPDPGGN